MKSNSTYAKRLLLSMLALMICLFPYAAHAENGGGQSAVDPASGELSTSVQTAGQAVGDQAAGDQLSGGETSGNLVVGGQAPIINCWVEKPNIQSDPIENYDNPDNFMFFKTLKGGTPEPYLTAAVSGKRFAHLLGTKTLEDGSVDAYYARGVFTYTFDVFSEIGEMTVEGVTYKADEPYTVRAKYEQNFVFPGLGNGLMPKNVDASLPNAYCAGWGLDERTGDEKLLTYASAVTEDMLPAEDMPYENLTFKLTAVWFDNGEKYVLSSWYEELPQDAAAEVNRKSYSGKVYVNYPATNFEVSLPKGTRPGASDAPGLMLVAQIAPDAGKPYPEGNTWYFVYDRQRFTLTIDSGIMEAESWPDVPYQQNLAQYDPGLDENTTRERDGVADFFAGWYQGDIFLGYHLNGLYMTPFDLRLEARWESR